MKREEGSDSALGKVSISHSFGKVSSLAVSGVFNPPLGGCRKRRYGGC
jgi:hypothetical protein